ncbi:MAG TPA: hypothetical protein VF733_04145 [Candidatus Saccharimonadales bacterium]
MKHSRVLIEQYTVAHDLRHADGRGLVGCMDRRLVMPGDPVLDSDHLFAQLRGGRLGLGGLALALEAKKPGRFINADIPIADFAQAMGVVLLMQGVITTKHGPICGGIEGATTIGNGVANGMNDEAMYQNALHFNPSLTEEKYLRVVEAQQRINAAGLASTPEQIKTALTSPSIVFPELKHATPHVELQDTDHGKICFAADYRKGFAFDRAAAHAAGYGAYYSSFGAFEDMLCAAPDTIADDVTLEDWWITESVVLGRIVTHDITNGGVPYPVEVIARQG